ncbi:hypothetical protein ACIHEI_25460 [Kitasatospora sp. NPDC051984]|uniref:hypothetical protein n=1 Tax=Kitasatospora sp. NPDC051984 TaxID=3364059 RepID=UPI0037C8CB1B
MGESYKINCEIKFVNGGEPGDPEPYGHIMLHPQNVQSYGYSLWKQELDGNSTPTVASTTATVTIQADSRPERLYFSGTVKEYDLLSQHDLLADGSKGMSSGLAGEEIKLLGGESKDDYVTIKWSVE